MQGRIEVPLSKLLRRPTEIVGAGRTDTDINVLYYVAHLYTTKEIDCDHIAYKLNAILPQEVMILATYPAPAAILNRMGYSSRTLNIVRMQNYLLRYPTCLYLPLITLRRDDLRGSLRFYAFTLLRA